MLVWEQSSQGSTFPALKTEHPVLQFTPTNPEEPPIVRPPIEPELVVARRVTVHWPREPDPGPQPRLGIIHIMLWTACVAVMLTIQGGIYQVIQTPEASVLRMLLRGAWAAVLGAGLATLFVFFARRRRGIPFPVHPGHWLLLILGTTYGLHQLAWVPTFFVNDWVHEHNDGVEFVQALVRASVPLAACGLYAVATAAHRCCTRWAVLFGLRAGASAFMCCLGLLEALMLATAGYPREFWRVAYLIEFFFWFVMAVTVVLDVRARSARDWLHWTGVAMIQTASTLACIWYLLNSFRITPI